jgi:hypothetical protein
MHCYSVVETLFNSTRELQYKEDLFKLSIDVAQSAIVFLTARHTVERPSQSHRTRVERRHTLIGRDPISRRKRSSCAELWTHKGPQPRQQGVIRARQQTTFRKCCHVPQGSDVQDCRYIGESSGQEQSCNLAIRDRNRSECA